MTDKLHCPFCGAELIPQNDIENTEPIRARCGNPGCPWFMWAFPWEIWQALIDGKKAQDALNRAISEITDLCTTILYCSGEADNEIQMIQMRDEMVKEAKARIFGEITSITK